MLICFLIIDVDHMGLCKMKRHYCKTIVHIQFNFTIHVNENCYFSILFFLWLSIFMMIVMVIAFKRYPSLTKPWICHIVLMEIIILKNLYLYSLLKVAYRTPYIMDLAIWGICKVSPHVSAFLKLLHSLTCPILFLEGVWGGGGVEQKLPIRQVCTFQEFVLQRLLPKIVWN